MKYMLDTNVFNRLIDGRLTNNMLATKELVATHIQLDELSTTKSDERRKALVAAFHETVQVRVPTVSSVWDVSRWDEGNWDNDNSKYNEMLARLSEMDEKSKKSPEQPALNRARDVLIAETAIVKGCTLLTSDRNLNKLCVEFGGSSELID